MHIYRGEPATEQTLSSESPTPCTTGGRTEIPQLGKPFILGSRCYVRERTPGSQRTFLLLVCLYIALAKVSAGRFGPAKLRAWAL